MPAVGYLLLRWGWCERVLAAASIRSDLDYGGFCETPFAEAAAADPTPCAEPRLQHSIGSRGDVHIGRPQPSHPDAVCVHRPPYCTMTGPRAHLPTECPSCTSNGFVRVLGLVDELRLLFPAGLSDVPGAPYRRGGHNVPVHPEGLAAGPRQ